jgi:hypothetical protein
MEKKATHQKSQFKFPDGRILVKSLELLPAHYSLKISVQVLVHLLFFLHKIDVLSKMRTPTNCKKAFFQRCLTIPLHHI